MKFLIVALAVCSAFVATQRRTASVELRTAAVTSVARPQNSAQSAAQARPPPPPPPLSAYPPRSPLHPSVRTSREVYEKGVDVPILKFESEVEADRFNYAYDTANGISAQEEGVLKKIEDKEAIVVTGSFKYTAPDGTPVLVTYRADENGFQPQSDLLPVAPPVPEAIARSLAYQAAHPETANPH